MITKVLYQSFEVSIDYSLMGKVQYEILQNGHVIYDTLYTEDVTFIVFVEYPQKDSFVENIINLTGNQVKCIAKKEVYGAQIEGKLHFFNR